MKLTEAQLASLTTTEREIFNCRKQKKKERIRSYFVFAITAFISVVIEVCFFFWNPSGFARIFMIALAGLIVISGMSIYITISDKADELDERIQEISRREICDKKRAFCLTKRRVAQWDMRYPRSHDS